LDIGIILNAKPDILSGTEISNQKAPVTLGSWNCMFRHRGKTSAHALTSAISGFELMRASMTFWPLCRSFSFGVLSNCPGTEFVGMALKSSKRRKIHPRVFPFSKKNLKLVISRCCFAEDGKEMYQNV